MAKTSFGLDGELQLPKVVEIEPTNYCNLRCRMCHVGLRPTPKDRVRALDMTALRNLGGLSNCYVKLGNLYEPTIHPHFVDIVKFLDDNKCELELVTNATTVSEEVARELAKCNFYYITLSLDSVDKTTYEKIRRGGNLDVVKRNIINFRREFQNKDTYFKINMVIMKSNIDQLEDMIDFAEEHGIDYVSFIIMELRDLEDGGLKEESLYPIREYAFGKLDEAAEYVLKNSLRTIISSRHYNHTRLREEYPHNFKGSVISSDNERTREVVYKRNTLQLGKHPQMKANCISPYTFASISARGDTQLCTMFSIGNVGESTFEAIWRGEKAQTIRERIIKYQPICSVCIYYKACLAPSAADLDLDNPLNYVGKYIARDAENLGPVEWNTSEKRGSCAAGESLDELRCLIDSSSLKRRLVEEGYRGYNIISIGDKLYGLAQSEGKLDLDRVGTEGYRCVVGKSVEEVKQLIGRTSR